MKISLLSYMDDNYVPCLGLASLAAILKTSNYQVQIVVKGTPYKNLSDMQIISNIQQFNPDIIGISVYTINCLATYEFLNKLRVFKKPIVAGGPHATIVPEELLKYGFDIVVIGEGEITLLELCGAIENKTPLSTINGICYIEKDRIIKTNPRSYINDLSQLPFPDKSLFNLSDFVKNKNENNVFGNMVTSRGCPGKCTFCCKGVYGNKYRYFNTEAIIQRMAELNIEYGVQHFQFWDDAFTANAKRIRIFCNQLLEFYKTHNLQFTFDCITKAVFLNEGLIDLMKEAGCTQITIGVESGDQFTLEKIMKNFDKDKGLETFKIISKKNIKVLAIIMFGFPWDSVASIRETRKYLEQINPYVSQFCVGGILLPYPGTQIYEEFKDDFKVHNWWLNSSFSSKYSSQHLFKRIFGNDIAMEKYLFQTSADVKKEIRRTMFFMGEEYIKKKTYWPLSIFIILAGKFSFLLYTVSPALDRIFFAIINKIFYNSYLFVFFKNAIKWRRDNSETV